MPRASPAFTSFNGGEFSPRMDGRVDFAKYPSACSVLENGIPTVQGPVRNRPGTHYVDSVLNPVYRSWLARFEFSYDQAFVLEFSNDKLGFFINRARLLNVGVPYTITTPYTDAGLTNSEGAFALSGVQTADIMYLGGAGKPPQKLSRLGNTNWTIAEYQPADGPYLDQNTTEATTVYASAASGAGITLTASASIFTANHVGALVRLDVQNLSSVRPWEAGKSITANDLRRADGKTYKALNTSTTGTVRPTHSKGTAFDGSDTATGVNWDFQDPGYGVARITAYTSGTVVTATVIKTLPAGVVGGGNATWRWSFGAWGAHNEYPTKVALWRDRLIWAGLRTIWMSVAGDYDSMAPDEDGQQTTESAINVTLGSSENNLIRWMQPTDALLVGTAGCEFAIATQTDSDPLGPANVKASQQSAYGGRNINAARVGEAVFFVDKSGRKVRESRYDINSNGYQARDVTVLSEHITRGGLVDMAYQASPDSILWAVRTDGKLLGFTYEREQEVVAWHPHTLGGGGIVEAVQSLPAPDGSRDDLWLIVRRTINGTTRRYVERMNPGYQSGDAQASAFYVDAGLTYSGAPATVLSGLSHLEGATVTVCADGASHPTRVVSGGSITLQRAASTAHVGLPYVHRGRTMRPEAGGGDGTSQGKRKRAATVVFRFLETLGAKFGRDFEHLDPVQFRRTDDAMDTAPPLFSGDSTVIWPGGYDTDGYICWQQDQPLPFTLVAIFPQITTNDR